MIKGDEITRENLINHLTKGFCKVQFRKQTDGRFRSLICTLDSKQIPGKFAKNLVNTLDEKNKTDLLPVFDIVERDWKSFYIPNVLYFHTEDHLRGSKEEPSDNKGVNNAKRTTDRRKTEAPKKKGKK